MKLNLVVLFSIRVLASSMKPRRAEPVPYYFDPEENLVDDEYIVMLQKGETLDTHFERIGKNLSDTDNTFFHLHVLNGYVAHLDQDTVHNLVRYDPGVKFVEHNRYIPEPVDEEPDQPTDLEFDVPAKSWFPRLKRWQEALAHNVPWNVRMAMAYEKIKGNPLSGHGYVMQQDGEGVDVYVLDSGIFTDHPFFEGKAFDFKDVPVSKYCKGESAHDVRGHGTAVAGQVHAHAAGATIVNVRVYCNDGSTRFGVVAFDDVIAAHIAKKRNPPPGWRGSVLNLSFETTFSESWRLAVEEAYRNGIPIAASAGNGNSNKKNSPCFHPAYVRCIASCDRKYRKSEFSDYGKKVSYVAPGSGIWSPQPGIKAGGDYKPKYGTSYAAPAVAGMMAIIVGYENLEHNPKRVYQRLEDNHLPNVVTGFDSLTPNKLANFGVAHPLRLASDPYYIYENTHAGDIPAFAAEAEVEVADESDAVAPATGDDGEELDDPSEDPIPDPDIPSSFSTTIGSLDLDWAETADTSFPIIPAEYITEITLTSFPMTYTGPISVDPDFTLSGNATEIPTTTEPTLATSAATDPEVAARAAITTPARRRRRSKKL